MEWCEVWFGGTRREGAKGAKEEGAQERRRIVAFSSDSCSAAKPNRALLLARAFFCLGAAATAAVARARARACWHSRGIEGYSSNSERYHRAGGALCTRYTLRRCDEGRRGGERRGEATRLHLLLRAHTPAMMITIWQPIAKPSLCRRRGRSRRPVATRRYRGDFTSRLSRPAAGPRAWIRGGRPPKARSVLCALQGSLDLPPALTAWQPGLQALALLVSLYAP